MIPEIRLAGSPRSRGHAHGEELRDLIAGAIDRWFGHIAARHDPVALTHAVAGAGFLDAAERHTPELVDEVRGIAEGSGQAFETMFAWQLVDECWWYLDEITGSLEPHEACSSMAVNHAGWGAVAQTQDLYRHFDGSQVMLRYLDDDGLEILAPSVAGLLALNGVNSAGVAICITTLSELAHRPDGVSSGFAMPTLMRCTSVDAALDWVRSTPLASGNSWTFGTRERSVVVEASAGDVVAVTDGDRAIHTNHALAASTAWEYQRFGNSVDRLALLDRSAQPTSTLDDLVRMYRTPPVCQSRSADADVMSVGTMIFEIGDEQICHYAPGPLDSDDLVTYRMEGARV